MKVEGEKLQQLRLEIEDIITRFESKADDFNARQEAYIAKYTERAFVMLSIPPLPDLSRQVGRHGQGFGHGHMRRHVHAGVRGRSPPSKISISKRHEMGN